MEQSGQQDTTAPCQTSHQAWPGSKETTIKNMEPLDVNFRFILKNRRKISLPEDENPPQGTHPARKSTVNYITVHFSKRLQRKSTCFTERKTLGSVRQIL